jgi:hypothetical protein
VRAVVRRGGGVRLTVEGRVRDVDAAHLRRTLR